MGATKEQLMEQLLNEHYVRAFNYARTLTKNEEDAKDLVQDTYVAIWQARERYDPEQRNNFWNYMRRVLLNKFYDQRRRAKAYGKQEGIELSEIRNLSDPTDLLACVDARLIEQQINRQIEQLDHETNTIMNLYLQGHSYDAIAQHLQMNKNTVKTRIHRVKKRLLRQRRELFCAVSV